MMAAEAVARFSFFFSEHPFLQDFILADHAILLSSVHQKNGATMFYRFPQMGSRMLKNLEKMPIYSHKSLNGLLDSKP